MSKKTGVTRLSEARAAHLWVRWREPVRPSAIAASDETGAVKGMAIYSFLHRPIGRTTRPSVACANVRYISGTEAASAIIGSVAQLGPPRWGSFERGLRANTRVGDRFVIALPREVSSTERTELVRQIVRELIGV